MNYQGLIEAATQAMEHTYSPYSNFPVGAALLLKDGMVVMGTNVENVSFGATNCAERSAIFAAISQGYTKDEFIALAVTGKTAQPIAPCCICRQVMVEFFTPETPIILHTAQTNEHQVVTLADLVPYSFSDLK
ncbi:MAG: cytidine deaminase [Culicoidibacterales bacterium]